MGTHLVLPVLLRATRHPFLAGSNRSGVAMKASLGKSVAQKYPSIVSERLVMEVMGRVRLLPCRRHRRVL